MEQKIGTIANYYGGLYIKEINKKNYWCIENHDGLDFLEAGEEIPDYLSNALIKFEETEQKEKRMPEDLKELIEELRTEIKILKSQMLTIESELEDLTDYTYRINQER